MLADPGDQVLLIKDGLTLNVVELQIAVDLAAALDQLLTESDRTPCAPVERRLEAVAHAIDEIYRADRITDNRNALNIAICLLMKGNRTSRKDAPIDAIGEALLCRKPETGVWRRQLGCVLNRLILRTLGPYTGQQQKTKNDGKKSTTPIQDPCSLFYFLKTILRASTAYMAVAPMSALYSRCLRYKGKEKLPADLSGSLVATETGRRRGTRRGTLAA